MKIIIFLEIISHLAFADLIGFNRMRNNMYNHYKTRVRVVCSNDFDDDAEAQYRRKILKFLKFSEQ